MARLSTGQRSVEPASAPAITGPADFVRVTVTALNLLAQLDPAHHAMIVDHVRHIRGLNRRETFNVGRAIFYNQELQPVTNRVDGAWVDRPTSTCHVTWRVWTGALTSDQALRTYAAILVHEAVHIAFDTDDEARCNAEMDLAVARLAAPLV